MYERCSFRRLTPAEALVSVGSHDLFRSVLGWLLASMSLTDIFSTGSVEVGCADNVIVAGCPNILRAVCAKSKERSGLVCMSALLSFP